MQYHLPAVVGLPSRNIKVLQNCHTRLASLTTPLDAGKIFVERKINANKFVVFSGIAFSKFCDEVKICCIEISLSGKYSCKPGGTLTRRLSQVRETPFPGASPFQDTPGYCITFWAEKRARFTFGVAI